MSIAKGIIDFLHGGVQAVLENKERQQPVVVNVNQAGGGNYPMIVPVSHPGQYALPNADIEASLPTPFSVTFEAIDEGTRDYLNLNQPVLVLIFDPNEPDETIVVTTELGDGLSGEFYPGLYSLLALVLMGEDMEQIDAIGVADFTIEDGEPPFDLRVAVSSDEEDIAEILGAEFEDADIAVEAEALDLDHLDEEQFDMLCSAAEDGDPEAQYQLGRMYITGRYFPDLVIAQDKDNGYQWLRLAANQGHLKARTDLTKAGLV